MDTRPLAIGAVALAAIFTGYAAFHAATTPTQRTPGMRDEIVTNPTPPVKGLYKGGEVLFIHTEASDHQVAQMLSGMMGPRVFAVPRLARIPQSLLADVYVFTNGVKGGGPFGFQADVFDSVPGEARYSPLRAVHLVSWREGARPHLLGSVEEIQGAVQKRDVEVKQAGVVVNMPIVRWPGGQR